MAAHAAIASGNAMLTGVTGTAFDAARAATSPDRAFPGARVAARMAVLVSALWLALPGLPAPAAAQSTGTVISTQQGAASNAEQSQADATFGTNLSASDVGGTQADDPPSLAGRIALIEGRAESWDLRDNAWREALLNETVAPRSAMRTGADARMEITLGTSALRLDRDTEVAWQQMEDRQIGVDLERGRIVISRRQESTLPPSGASWSGDTAGAGYEAVPIEVRAGEVVARITGAAVARLEYDDTAHRLDLTVLAGEATLDHGGNRSPVRRGQMLSVDTRTASVLSAGAAEKIAFDDWSFDRDRRASARPSYRYVSPSMTGAEALDDHGRWDVHESWGPVWYPTVVASGWAPYRQGRWMWSVGWGWTWVDAAPWGFAPFHYGRWVQVGPRWGWVPGRYVRRPVYAPALVGFHGGPGGVRPGVAPRVGWFPLAPAEIWRPPYRHSLRYFEAVNHGYRAHIDGPGRARAPAYREPRGGPEPRYRYAREPGATTIVDRARFAGGPIDVNRHRIGIDELRRLPAPAWQAPVAAPRVNVPRPGPGRGGETARRGPPNPGDRPMRAPPVEVPREWRAAAPNQVIRPTPGTAPGERARGSIDGSLTRRDQAPPRAVVPPAGRAIPSPNQGSAPVRRPQPRQPERSSWQMPPSQARVQAAPASREAFRQARPQQAPRAATRTAPAPSQRSRAGARESMRAPSAGQWRGRQPDARLR